MRLMDLLNERKREAERRKKVDTAKKFALGTAIGAIAGLLFAPKSGKETRKDIADKTKEKTENIKTSIKESVATLKDVEEKVKEDVKEKLREFKERDMFEVEIEKYKSNNVEKDQETEEENERQ
ncbi:YtxH domain-containing protein [Tepidimicrobium xylanilyticum]|uniref:Gas vesicle protein n=1 Tax=Tepidimicrobium xylanilyticum TaxID=1123352 RepID=A0A1H3A8W4_9FIRM|nr:YtxH domain-containing protein [Tepidimicrobium xylanilyticum]GMG96286.1 general stress protein [Tepidimicrobium xylanilyticum]SDX25911.1 Gas vesicle protein [Tepidimicrobium xylanilyticum]